MSTLRTRVRFLTWARDYFSYMRKLILAQRLLVIGTGLFFGENASGIGVSHELY
jgi:hypothetical protein